MTSSIISSYIQGEGYRVLPIPSSESVDDEKIRVSFSHKLGARLAGLGCAFMFAHMEENELHKKR